MLDIDMESLDMDADAGRDQVDAAGTSAVGREAVNSRLLCRRNCFTSQPAHSANAAVQRWHEVACTTGLQHPYLPGRSCCERAPAMARHRCS
jgi:hypothetical protein